MHESIYVLEPVACHMHPREQIQVHMADNHQYQTAPIIYSKTIIYSKKQKKNIGIKEETYKWYMRSIAKTPKAQNACIKLQIL